MFGSSILDVAIGMAVVYLILSLIASVVQEAIAALVQSRSANLLQGLHSLFSGDAGPDGKTQLLSALYNHGLIRGLYRDPKKDSKIDTLGIGDKVRMILQNMLGLAPPKTGMDLISNRMLLPAYIPSRAFALAMIDLLNPAESGADVTLANLRATLATGVKSFPENKALEALSALADSAGNDIKEFQRRLEDWYNDAMDRVSGWYKKYTQKILMAIGLILAIAFNVSSIRVAKTLWTDKDAREAMVAVAKEYIAAGPPAAAQATQSTTTPQGGASASAGVPNQDASGQGQTSGGAGTSASVSDLATKLSKPIETVQQIEDKHLLPLGWNGGLYAPGDGTWPIVWKTLLALVGWVITALALSLGASFWFDTLNKFMVIRGTIKPDEKSQPEPSKG